MQGLDRVEHISTSPSATSQRDARDSGLITAVLDAETSGSLILSGTLESESFSFISSCATVELQRDTTSLIELRRIAFANPRSLVYPESVDDVSKLWAEKQTLTIQALEAHSGIANQVCGELTRLIGCLVTASIYISQPFGESFGIHTDNWDAFILQLAGSKTFLCPEIEREYFLEPGNWLFLRNGQLHQANTETHSVHISFNIHTDKKLKGLFLGGGAAKDVVL